MQLSLAYVFYGPDGTRAVVGNSLEAKQDPDWVGWLDPEQGITGLLDGAEVRESYSDLPEADGGTHGAFYLTRRTGTVNVIFDPNGTIEDLTLAEQKFKRATRGLRGNVTLRWTPTVDGIERQLLLRRQTRFDVRGRRPKTCQVGMAAADAFITSASVNAVTISPDQTLAEVGISDPIRDPITSDANAAGQDTLFNNGDVPAWPWFRIEGPITNPVVLNNRTGEQIVMNYSLVQDEFLTVYAKTGRVLLGGTEDRFSAYDFEASQFWRLLPGSNDIRVLASAYSGGSSVTIYWRHTWE
jgi:hypothetical protein